MLKQQKEAKAKRKAAQEDLDKKIDAKYPTLTEAEIKTLVVDDKWMARISAAVQSELDRVSQTLSGRIRQLAERYATPLPKLTDEVSDASVPPSMSTWRRWGRYGTEAGLQAVDEVGRCHSGRLGY